MSTCSTVAYIQTDGKLKAIHVQLNGHDLGVGLALETHYTSREEIEGLMSLGNVGFLFDKPTLNTVEVLNKGANSISRCRNFDIQFGGRQTFNSVDEWFDFFDECDYAYFFDGDEWIIYKNIIVS